VNALHGNMYGKFFRETGETEEHTCTVLIKSSSSPELQQLLLWLCSIACGREGLDETL